MPTPEKTAKPANSIQPRQSGESARTTEAGQGSFLDVTSSTPFFGGAGFTDVARAKPFFEGPWWISDPEFGGLAQDLRVGLADVERLRITLIPGLERAAGGGAAPPLVELETVAAMRRIETAIAHAIKLAERYPGWAKPAGVPEIGPSPKEFPLELARERAQLETKYAELKPRVQALLDQVVAARAKPKPVAPVTPAPPPVSYTKHAAAPPKVDFGKVKPGTQGFVEVPIYNLTPYTASVSISYQGDGAIQVIRSPQYSREADVQMTEEDRNIKLVFTAPTKHGSHYGTLSISFVWSGGADGPAPETLTIPVVAYALYEDENTPEEQVAEDRSRKLQADQEAAVAKRRAEEDRAMAAFSKAHPRVDTDRFDDATDELYRAMDQFFAMQISGVHAAQQEVLLYKKERPPLAQDTLMFALAMLALDFASAGVAGFLAKRLETMLKATYKTVVRPVAEPLYPGETLTMTVAGMGKEIAVRLSDPMIAGITDSVKEAIKGSSRLARQQAQGAKKQGGAGPVPGKGKTSADWRIAFFQAQRDTLILARTDINAGVMRSIALLRPTILKNEALAVAAVEGMTRAIRAELEQVSNTYAYEAIRQWAVFISDTQRQKTVRLDLDVNRVGGALDYHAIAPLPGVIDIGFEVGDRPRDPVVAKSAIIRGLSNTAAQRFVDGPLIDLGVPVRAYGLPSRNWAEVLVTVFRSADGFISYRDETQGLAPGPGTYLRSKGGNSPLAGAKKLIETEIMSKSLKEWGVPLKTDQDPSVAEGAID